MKELLQLMGLFLEISILCPGGGATMMPLLVNDLCEKRGWFTMEEIAEGYALAQSLPGPIAANTAVYFGEKRMGLKGAAAAAIGAIIPAVVSIVVIFRILDAFYLETIISWALAGVKSASVALICHSAYMMIKTSIRKPADIVLFADLICLMLFLDVSAYICVVIAAFVGAAAFAVGRVRGGDR